MEWIAWFSDASCEDVSLSGGKGASLSRMARAGLPVPPGFVVCTTAFRHFLAAHQLEGRLHALLGQVDATRERDLRAVSATIRHLILELPMPEPLATSIAAAYRALGNAPRVAVRSSAAAEDSQAASFAGQQETYLNVQGEDEVLRRVRACWASLFTPRALFYRGHKTSVTDIDMAVVVQEMIAPEKAGVMFTVDPVLRRRDRVMIEAAWGLGESVVAGRITPDHYVLDKATGQVLTTFVPAKQLAVVPDERGSGVREIELDPEQAQGRVLSDAELVALAELGQQLEAHFGQPQDVEWGIAGDRIYVLQSRPVTTL